MGISATANNVIGAFGYLYLIFIGGAIVGWVGVACQVALVSVVLLSKIYIDFFYRQSLKSEIEALAIPSGARVDVAKFLGGTASRFPLLEAEAAHVAAHLLLDCRLKLAATSPDGTAEDIEAANKGLETLKLDEFADILEKCLGQVDLQMQRRQSHSFPSFKRQSTGADSLNAENLSSTASSANMCFIPTNDGYVTAMWLPGSGTLAVDFVGASPETIAGMNKAAASFCKELTIAYPQSMIVASTLSRLPAL